MASLINGRTYAKCWQAYNLWLTAQFGLGNSTSLAPIGIIYRPSSNYGSSEPKMAAFRFLRPFLTEYQIQGPPGSEPLDILQVSLVNA